MTQFTKEILKGAIAAKTVQEVLSDLQGEVTLEVRDEPLALAMVVTGDYKDEKAWVADAHA